MKAKRTMRRRRRRRRRSDHVEGLMIPTTYKIALFGDFSSLKVAYENRPRVQAKPMELAAGGAFVCDLFSLFCFDLIIISDSR